MDPSVQELATRAASRAVAEAARNITPPKSAYEFEISWRGFSGDHALEARLLKVCRTQQPIVVFVYVSNSSYVAFN